MGMETLERDALLDEVYDGVKISFLIPAGSDVRYATEPPPPPWRQLWIDGRPVDEVRVYRSEKSMSLRWEGLR